MNYTAKLLGVFGPEGEKGAPETGEGDRFGLNVIVMPAPLTPFEEFMQLVGDSSVYEGLKFNARLGQTVKPMMDQFGVINSMGPLSTYEPLKIQ